jgi:hypothetical protein
VDSLPLSEKTSRGDGRKEIQDPLTKPVQDKRTLPT